MSNLDRFKFRGFIQKTGNRNPFMFYGISFKLYVDDDVVLFDENGNKSPMFKIKNLMQCTGLKDKNGNLIYEGDILSIPFSYNFGKNIKNVVIAWQDGCFGFKIDKSFFEFRIDSELNLFEIIGNIYENLDLLK